MIISSWVSGIHLVQRIKMVMHFWDVSWKWKCGGGLIMTLVIIIIFLLCDVFQNGEHSSSPSFHSRGHLLQKMIETSDSCIKRHGGIELDYVLGSDTTFQFDLCSVFTCEGSELTWTKYNVYLSIYQKGAVDGMENIGKPAQGFVIWDTKQG
ncbi:hypothetical protein AMECASPLE_037297 [Ameca splendens]|uniref:Uncharacterized protein n=1 Tax=Ameca splendens TaxID=208324 RepID=A0ABV0ZST0_9TELE